jgi:hypothetical protein|tara:strand:- start:4 stop:219 length:216 start_codon:yes stop_codon:yes gene_type:complete
MLSKDVERLIKENEKYTQILEEYDQTGVFPLKKIRRSFTLKHRTVRKLRELSKQSGKNMSEFIDFLIETSN